MLGLFRMAMRRARDGVPAAARPPALFAPLAPFATFATFTRFATLATFLTVGVGTALGGADGGYTSEQLKHLSLEELANVDISLATKTAQKLSRTAAAAYVITQEDIRRSGATSIPELLRMVPGLIVARINSNQWAISARFANGQFSNKFQVLMDGRVLYSPLFAGTFWDEQDYLLADIDRIEVIRGPGAALWGANAVAGIINIITKSAGDTQGWLSQIGTGNKESFLGSLRYGGKLSENGEYRVYGKRFNRSPFDLETGASANDGWGMSRGGFRVDRRHGNRDAFTLQGDVYDGNEQSKLPSVTVFPPFSQVVDSQIPATGDNGLFRWNRQLSDASDMTLQLYHDATDRMETGSREKRSTDDLDFQRSHRSPSDDEFVWGLGYRTTHDTIDNRSPSIAFTPAARTDQIGSAFAQQCWAIPAEHLNVTLGSRFEVNSYTGFEVQPSLRAAYVPSARRTLWAAVSRAVRTPSRSESDVRFNLRSLPAGSLFPGSPTAIVTLFGNPDLKAERLLSYELGYRVQPTERLALDVALYYDQYDDLITSVSSGLPSLSVVPVPHLTVPLQTANDEVARIHGADISVTLAPARSWKLFVGYSRLDLTFRSGGIEDTLLEGKSPRNQSQLRSYWTVTPRLDLDAFISYVDALPSIGVPSYTRTDLRAAVRPRPSLEASLTAQNLLSARHTEFGQDVLTPPTNTQIERSFLASLVWKF